MTDQPRDPATEVHRVADPVGHARRLLPRAARRGLARAAALLGRPGHERDAQVDPGRVRGRGRRAHRQPRPAGRGLRGRARARRCSSARSTATSSTRARSSRTSTCCPAIKANADYGDGYPLFTALGRPLIAKLAVEYARQHGLRHDRPRLHRQGQRPGADRGHGRDARARAQGDRAGALVGDGPRRGDRLRAQARDPGQGRHGERAVLDRRQPLGALLGGQVDRGPLARARRRRLPARHPARARARRGADGDRRASRRASRWRSTASGSGSST